MPSVRDKKREDGRPSGGSGDGRESASPYSRRQRSGYGLVLLIGLLVVGAFLAYGAFHRGEVPSSGPPQPTAGSTR
ncbi:hypothetical protein [uncultured Enterovirga sp.]|uniref:hypothetical protein n=1 Tax=uncultured Enterovirga sp. TaxID=2026352 RepID=UPI0035CB9605